MTSERPIQSDCAEAGSHAASLYDTDFYAWTRDCMSTNYRNAFIRVAGDCPVKVGTEPSKPGTIAALQLGVLRKSPYALTSDDLLFETYVVRSAVPMEDRAAARERFFAKPQACLRASPLAKQFGWGLHHDANERVAVYAMESPEYAELAARPDLTIVPAMRNKRG